LRLEVTVETPGEHAITRDEVIVDRVPRSVRGSSTSLDASQLEALTNVNGLPTDFLGLYQIHVSTGGLDARSHEVLRGLAAQVTYSELSNPQSAIDLGFPFDALPAWTDDEEMVLASESIIRNQLNADTGVHAYVARP